VASLRYHAGRMVLKKVGDAWQVRIKTNGKHVVYALNAIDLEQAVLEAEYIYADVKAINRGQPRCMDCIHWEIVAAKCSVGCPEGRMTGGTFAKDCAYFWDKKT